MYTKINRIIILIKQNKLTKVDLAGTKLSDVDLNQLSDAIKENTCLKKLVLGGIVVGCKIGDDGIKYIAAMIEGNSSLNYLDLRTNFITDKGVQLLSDALEKNNTLNFLDLRSNLISSHGKNFLSTQLLKKNIEILFDE